MLHTAGFGYDFFSSEIGAYMAARGVPGIIGRLSDRS